MYQGICQEFSCEAGATYSLEAGVCRDLEAAKQQQARPPGLTRDQGTAAASAGWSPWQPASKCSFTCLVPARGLQMMSRVCEARVCEGVDSTLGLCEDAASSCRKLVTPFQFASQTCENFRISKLSGVKTSDLFHADLLLVYTRSILTSDWLTLCPAEL